MKEIIRKWLWKLLGADYQQFLKNQRGVYLSDFKSCQIGKASYDNGALVWKWHPDAKLTIGSYCSIAHGVEFFLDSGFHNFQMVTTFPFFNELYKRHGINDFISPKMTKGKFCNKVTDKMSVQIGNDVWIGSNAMIMPGVSIADGAVILPGAVVTANVGPYEIMAGVPAKTVAKRFNNELIEQLLKIQWWKWDETLIRERLADFYENPSRFVSKYGSSCMYVS